ncbi:MAG: hypothetical protein JRC92_12160, partial [Deltaproteobacteria bacterium]|nr:hypothetical protein [Deltaproteobacteria bacterium]
MSIRVDNQPHGRGNVATGRLSLSEIGRITSQQVCPECGLRGRYNETQGGLICQCDRFSPELYDITVYHRRQKLRITHDHLGRRIDGYRHARRVLEVIRSRDDEGAFNPQEWAGALSNRSLWPNFVDDYLDREALRLLPERRATYDKKRSLCRHLRLGFQCHVRSVTTAMVRDYLAKPCLRLALSPKTISDLAGELRYLLRDAQIRGVIVHPPPVPSIQVPETPIQWLDVEAQDQVLRLIPETHRPIFGFLFLYGCRVGEACALCWDQIDVENGAFYLARTFSRRRLSQTNKTKRLAPLPVQPEFVEILEEEARGYRIR